MGIFGQDDDSTRAMRRRTRGAARTEEGSVKVSLDGLSFKIDVDYVQKENSNDGQGNVSVGFELTAKPDDPGIGSHWPKLSGHVTYEAPSNGRRGTDLGHTIQSAYDVVKHALQQWANDARDLSRDALPETDPPIHWFPLSHPNPLPNSSKPSALRFPDGTTKKVPKHEQYKLVVALVEWLRLQNFLQDDDLPIRRHTGNRRSPNAKDQLLVVMREDRERLRNKVREAADLFVESHFPAQIQAENMCTIIECAGQNPSDFAIQRELVDGV